MNAKQGLPYGVMLWGDCSGLSIPANVPRGTKVVGADGLFIPMVLKPGFNRVDLTFDK